MTIQYLKPNNRNIQSMPQENSMHIYVLGASFKTHNMGVSALTAGIIKSIDYCLPDAKIVLLDYEANDSNYTFKLKNKNVLLQIVNIRFSKNLYLKNNIFVLLFLAFIIRLVPTEKARRCLCSKHYYLSRLMQSGMVASIAGGDSFSDIYGLQRFLYISLPQVLALLLGKKLIVLPQTLGPFNGKMVKTIARFILKRSRIIYSRDHIGTAKMQQFIRQTNENDKLRFCYDLGFIVDPIVPKDKDEYDFLLHKSQNSNIVGINISGLLYMGGYTQNNMFGLKVDYRELVDDIINFFIEMERWKIILVPHVFGTTENRESDFIVCNTICNKFTSNHNNQIYAIRNAYNQSEIKAIIGLADFFVGSRMHACIAALSQGIPTVAIAYSKKFQGVLESIGCESLVADPRIMEMNKILTIISDTFCRRHLIRRELEHKMPQIQKRTLNLFKDIMQTI